MRDVPGLMAAIWQGGQYVGDTRPIARVSVHKPSMRLVPSTRAKNLFTSFVFNSTIAQLPIELPNVRSVEWDRDVDNEAASCTITFWNTDPLPIGQVPTGDLDRSGYYTYNRGTTAYSGHWGHSTNEWRNKIMPDMVLSTFEGYGFNPNVEPDQDTNLVKTGEWLVDEVQYSADGVIVATCRDYGRLLHDHIAMPPVVPFRAGFVNKDLPEGAYSYPVSFAGVDTEPIITRVRQQETVKVAATGGRIAMTYDNNSNHPYVGVNGTVLGRHGRDAFDDDSSTWWISVGNFRGDVGFAFEWIQGKVSKQQVRRVRFRVRGGPYTCYLSLMVNGSWIGSNTVTYDYTNPSVVPDNGAAIKYHRSMRVGADEWAEFELGTGVKDVTHIRLTFGGLWNSGVGPFLYRAAVRRFEAYGGTAASTQTIERWVNKETTFADRNYDDYTDIAKLFAAWAGFYRPPLSRKRMMDSSIKTFASWNDESLPIPMGTVHGDWVMSGASGPAPISATVFDKKPIIDCIAYVRDILGFILHVDEHGGIIFRPPNIYRVGNQLRSVDDSMSVRTNRMITIDERQVLMDLTATISSKNVRERVFVSNGNGTVGHMAAGWNPNPVGMRRIAGWTDSHFQTAVECKVMAELITIRQLMSYRTDQVTIPGYPGIQIDDQVRIMERVTSEGFIHYVKGISSKLDMESGEYTYTLSTHWLGERAFTRWAFDPAKLSRETQAYLRGLYG